MSDVKQQGAGNGLEIAIVGMSGRFPGAEDVGQLWRNLRDGVESLTVYSDEELKAAGTPLAHIRSPQYVRVGRRVPGNDLFDAAFFGVSPREAEVLDPQQRLFLECCWSALEDAGYDPERLPGAVGVFAGARLGTYLMNIYSNPALLQAIGDIQAQIANDKDYIATRVSYKLNLLGPSITVQTACSTSLVAVHLASQSLLSGECYMALAGGVSIRTQEVGYLYSEQGVTSPDGRIRAFDAKAGGTMFGSGLGAVVLKRLPDALADGDTIHAVIKGSAVTNDGSQKVGFTAPGVDGQVRVLRAALAMAEVDPRTISYIEAHGTGTPVGDPIEVAALTQVFRESTDERQFCALGTVKTNISHLGAAAGVAGLIKTALALEHRQIPPSLLFEEPNPQIDFESSPFFVNTRLREWTPRNGTPLRAGVSSFGMGGTNAHAVLEEAPAPPPAAPSRPWQLLLLSARSETALATQSENLAAFLAENPDVSLPDAAATLQRGRKLLEHRRAVVCRDAEHVRRILGGAEPEWTATAFNPARESKAAFLFSGQGAQYPGMGRGLYESEPAFRRQVDLCCDLLHPHLGLDLRELLLADDGDAEAAERLSQTRFTQPALFVVEHALARLWMEWGIVPQAMIGHSIGEYVAATLAGVFSLEDALALVAERGRLMQGLPAGAMLAVPLSESETAPFLGTQLSLAAVNAPDRSVVSGPSEAVEALRADLAVQGIVARPLHTSHAFHSGMMEPVLAPFVQRFAGIALHAPQIPYLSNVTGTWITPEQATDPAYWAQHLRQAVRFAAGIRELCRDPRLVLLEVGPGQTLATLARQHPERGTGRVVLSSLRGPKERQPDLPVLLKALGQLWMAGVQPDWDRFYAEERRRRIPLPTYPFERRRFWVELGAFMSGAEADAGKKEDIADWFYLPYWKPSVAPPRPAELAARWLVFADDEEVATPVTDLLAGKGRSVVTVRPAADFRKLGPAAYEIRPGAREDYDTLISDLAVAGSLPDRVLHLWNAGPPPADADEVPAKSFWSLLFLAQALGRNNVTQPIRMAVVSSHVQRVAGEDRLVPERAMLLGPSKIIPAEYPNVRSVSVDVALPVDAALAARLVAEAESEPAHRVVAWRGASRWVQAYEAVRLGSPAPEAVRLRPGGTYLITGGFGGIGFTYAEFLAREYKARLALVGSSPLPDRAEWDEWLRGHDESDRTARRIRQVRALEALGSEVLVCGADVADRGRVRALVDEVVARFGAVHGLIHTAGVPGGGMIQLKTAEVAGRVIAPKVQGTRALLDALAGAPLDFVLLCSSTIAVTGGLGQVDYCAANNFLDAVAHDAALAGGPRTLSVNWGGWEEVGMAVASGLMPGRAAASAHQPQAAEEIHPLLDRRAEAAGRIVYSTRFSPARHWVLGEHMVLKIPTLPGTTYLELARAAFLHHTGAADRASDQETPVEIRDVYFLGPLQVPEGGEREVQVTLEPAGEGYQFQIASRLEAGPGGEPAWQPHARGKVAALAEPPARERYDVSELLALCSEREIEITGPLMSSGNTIVHWGPRWQTFKRAHVGGGAMLAWIELPEELAAETSRFGLHPALLDVATGIMGFVDEDNHLPLSYQRLRIYRHLPGRFYSWLRQRGETGQGGETLAVDVVLLDETGAVLVEIDRFVLRTVGSTAEDTLRRATSAPAAVLDSFALAAAAPAGYEGAAAGPAGLSEGILPHEGVEVLRRLLSADLELPQIVATAKDLHNLIAAVTTLNRASIQEATGTGPASKGSHERPNIPTPYVAPATAAERRLAEVWQATLGIDKVGVNDSFFDLGGDSILGIHLIARATEAGFQLTPDQLFEHPTLGELARVAGGVEAPGSDGADGTDRAEERPLPVTARQRELLEAGADAPCWSTVWALPAAPGLAPADLLERAVEGVAARHPALNTFFSRQGGGWTQTPGRAAAVRVGERTAQPDDVVAELRGSLAPERAALLAAAVLSEGGGSPARAVLVAHPAAVDGLSWRLLRDEAQTACRQLAAGGELDLPAPGTPFHRWLAARLAGAPEPGAAAGWRAALERAAPFSADSPSGSVSVRLDGEDTRALLDEVPDLQRIRVEELILAALARTAGRVHGDRPLLVEIEVDGREAGAAGADLTRTVGCFTAAVPVLLEPAAPAAPEEELREVKEQIRAGAQAGLESAGLDAPDLPAAAVRFTYLGDAQLSGGKPRPGAVLAVTAQLDGEGLRFDWSGPAAADLAGPFPGVLCSLIASCRSSAGPLYSPSDFPDAELSQEELDRLFSNGVS